MRKDELDALKSSLDCREVAKQLLPGRGNRFWCPRCQANGGKTPDLSPKKISFVCYKCGWGGDVIELVMKCTGYDFPRTIEYLGGRIEFIPNVQSECHINVDTKPNISLEERNAIYSTFSASCREVDGTALAYLIKRGIGADIVKRMKLRFCGREYGTLINNMEQQFGKDKLLAVGLMTQGKKGPYPTFWPYYASKIGFLVIPYIQSDQLVYLKARPPIDKAIATNKGIARFLNTGGAVPCLYNVDVLEGASQVLICEGETDTMTAMTYDFAAVGIPGWGHFKNEWVELFRNKDTFLALDCDNAGNTGTQDIATKFYRACLPVPKQLILPENQDLNAYLLKLTQNS